MKIMEGKYWLIIVVILIGGYLLINNINVTIGTPTTLGYCNTTEIYSVTPLDSTFDNTNYPSPIPLDCWLKCKSTGRFELSCKNNISICKCKATLSERFFG